jgi:hypothetical protein
MNDLSAHLISPEHTDQPYRGGTKSPINGLVSSAIGQKRQSEADTTVEFALGSSGFSSLAPGIRCP